MPDIHEQNTFPRAEIDLGAIARNVSTLRRIVDPGAVLMAVVKADAYGHGAEPVARTALASGAEWLGVARFEEAVQLRQAKIHAPILIFGYTPPAEAAQLIRYDLRQALMDLDSAEAYAAAARRMGKRIRVHIKVDTGMGRLGFPVYPEKTHLKAAMADIRKCLDMEGLEAEGVFSHFADADSDDFEYTRMQLNRFLDFLERFEKQGGAFPIRHIANSGGILQHPESHLDMVRAGIATYGLYPSDAIDRKRAELRPAMSLKSRISQVKAVPAGVPLSYGMTYVTTRPTRIATVAIGYADGLNRLLSSKGVMLVRGRRVPIVGRVCMDLTLVDVGAVPEAAVGDEVTIFGRQGRAEISADEMARTLNTINYEIVSTITSRVKRYYKNP